MIMDKRFHEILGLTIMSYGLGSFPHYENDSATGLPIFSDDSVVSTAEFAKRFEEQRIKYPLYKLRIERNELLKKSDWTQGKDIVLANNEEWITYRQALRDLPANIAEIYIDDNEKVMNVEMPLAPK